VLPKQHGAVLGSYNMALSFIKEEPLLAAEAFPPYKLAAIEQLSVDPVSTIKSSLLVKPLCCSSCSSRVNRPTTASVPKADEGVPQLALVSLHSSPSQRF
jgi:hypothetical protein